MRCPPCARHDLGDRLPGRWGQRQGVLSTAISGGDLDGAVRLASQAQQTTVGVPGVFVRWCSWPAAQACRAQQSMPTTMTWHSSSSQQVTRNRPPKPEVGCPFGGVWGKSDCLCTPERRRLRLLGARYLLARFTR